MHTRGVTKRLAKGQETEEDRREEETETVPDTEMEQQAGDGEEARGGPDWNKFIELMSSMKEDIKQTNEKFDSIKENNIQTNENLLKRMEEKFDRNRAVSYTHLDVYKRQITTIEIIPK